MMMVGRPWGGIAMKTKARKRKGKPDPAVLADIVKRVVRAAKPEKIVLFGSAARGEMGPNSDIDLLVIKRGKFNRHGVTVAIYDHLSGEAAVDVVVVTPEEVERYRDTHCLVICPALREGKVIYEAKTLSARRSSRTIMNPNATNALHQPETEFHGELQAFSGPAFAPDDPSLEPRVRKGRPEETVRHG
jgi:predicted nucleotidyltransferase